MKGLEGFTVAAVPNEQDYVARLRVLLTVVLGALFVTGVVGCASAHDSSEAVPVAVSDSAEKTSTAVQNSSAGEADDAPTSGGESTSTTVVRPATSIGPGASSVSSTTSPEQTLPTLPLRYAEETPLLKEVATAYYSGYNDFAVAAIASTPDVPKLANHIGGPQLEKLRMFIRGDLFDGWTTREAKGVIRWVRIETFEIEPSGDVLLTVCRSSNLEAYEAATGREKNPSPFIPNRFIERMHQENGVWKWWGREWIDTGGESDFSDCALP